MSRPRKKNTRARSIYQILKDSGWDPIQIQELRVSNAKIDITLAHRKFHRELKRLDDLRKAQPSTVQEGSSL